MVAATTHQIEWALAAVVFRKIPYYFILWLLTERHAPVSWSVVPPYRDRRRQSLELLSCKCSQPSSYPFMSVMPTALKPWVNTNPPTVQARFPILTIRKKAGSPQPWLRHADPGRYRGSVVDWRLVSMASGHSVSSQIPLFAGSADRPDDFLQGALHAPPARIQSVYDHLRASGQEWQFHYLARKASTQLIYNEIVPCAVLLGSGTLTAKAGTTGQQSSPA